MTKVSKYESASYQNDVSNFVQREVIYCVSSLISELATLGKYSDDLFQIFAQDDYISTVEEELGQRCDTQEEAREVCEQNELEAQTKEAYEHWIVTGWLADKLEAKGEMILRDFMGIGAIWGRSCTGQAIHMDIVICEIFDELHAKETANKRKAATLDSLISVKP